MPDDREPSDYLTALCEAWVESPDDSPEEETLHEFFTEQCDREGFSTDEVVEFCFPDTEDLGTVAVENDDDPEEP